MITFKIGALKDLYKKNIYLKYYDKNKESSYLQYWDVNNLYRCAMSQKLLVNNFKQVEDISEFDKSFMKNYNEEGNEVYFAEVDIQYPEIYINFTMIYQTYVKKMNLLAK